MNTAPMDNTIAMRLNIDFSGWDLIWERFLRFIFIIEKRPPRKLGTLENHSESDLMSTRVSRSKRPGGNREHVRIVGTLGHADVQRRGPRHRGAVDLDAIRE